MCTPGGPRISWTHWNELLDMKDMKPHVLLVEAVMQSSGFWQSSGFLYTSSLLNLTNATPSSTCSKIPQTTLPPSETSFSYSSKLVSCKEANETSRETARETAPQHRLHPYLPLVRWRPGTKGAAGFQACQSSQPHLL